MIAKACGRILHYPGDGGFGGTFSSRAMVSEAERTMQQHARYDGHNVGRRSAFAKTDMAPEWVCNDLDLAAAWALGCSLITTETGDMRLHRLDSELAKIGEQEWSLWLFSGCSANAGRYQTGARAPTATSSVVTSALRTTHQEAERLLRKR
ncbi:Importin subunit beta-1 [Hordeum vulgare]|nr:Importin subunit beta-1 [Hordeum vulgare]